MEMDRFYGSLGPTSQPIPNPYSWANLINMIRVNLPAMTGFSPGPSTVKDEIDVANQFMDLWRHFVDLFGSYVPYVASQMLDAEDERYFKVSGVQINDPWVNDEDVTMNAPAAEAMNYFQSVFALNDSFMADINKHANDCGYKRISPRWHLHTLP
ncbi:hypothetical protein AJ80_09022 [Polytolypa hystricis UAMH7299]|uniref:Uncharacterized protein n=1 Tax=Polytolypa hystricis (strain UAMH7299) TaxID=1447883 RepID=A0A2B7WXU7_POLH7|nr:hypothetical protein AJ80_09022 [Polytolypa hystricis UAMH7299]